MKSRVGSVAQLVFVDLLGSVAWFPVWWYTTGFLMMGKSALSTLRYRSESYAFRVWLQNFFTPMYGQYDWTGRLISVFMRFVVLVGRAIAIVFEAAVYAVGLVLWAALPIVALIALLTNLSGGFVF
jgi:hypothetical protein